MAVGVVAGPMYIVLNGTPLKVMGDHTYNLGLMKGESVRGPNNELHGIKYTPQDGKVSGKIVVTPDVLARLPQIMSAKDATVILTLPTGGAITLSNAFQSSEGDGSTEEGTLDYEFTGDVKSITTSGDLNQPIPTVG